MKKQDVLKKVVLASLIVLIGMSISGCGANKTVAKTGERGIMFEYNMPQNEILKYHFVTTALETAQVKDKKIDVNVNSSIDFSVGLKGEADNILDLLVKIDGMTQKLAYMGKEINADLSSVIGREFGMTMSGKGNVVDASEAEELKYDIVPGRTRDLSSSFKNIFPKLPAESIKVGESWKASDTITEKTLDGEVHIIINSVNTLGGFKMVKGRNCAKITSDFSGFIQGKSKEKDVDLFTSGTLEGNDEWYFDYKDGVIVMLSTEGTATTKTLVKGKEEMEIPGTRSYSYLTELVD